MPVDRPRRPLFYKSALIALMLVATSKPCVAAGRHPSIPAIGSLDGLGVNIHFTDPQPGELEMIASAGFKWVRMDLMWAGTERKKASPTREAVTLVNRDVPAR